MKLSASSTSSSTTCSSQDENEMMATTTTETVAIPSKDEMERDESSNGVSRKSEHTLSFGPGAIYSNSSMSTLSQSHYQSLPLSGGNRRITVQFDKMKIVVPWKEATNATVQQLADAALLRYKRARGIDKNEQSLKILRLECASDNGILDMEDVLEEVFDLNYDQIVAITDETNQSATLKELSRANQHHYAQPLPIGRKEGPGTPSITSSTLNNSTYEAYGSMSMDSSSSLYAQPHLHKNQRDGVVEVKSFDEAVSPGLYISKSAPVTETKPILRSSLRAKETKMSVTEDDGRPSTSSKHARVTLSPEVEKKLIQKETKQHYEKNPGRLHRGSDRKSRINDAFLDARDRLVEKMEQKNHEAQVDSDNKTTKLKRTPPISDSQGNTIITFPFVENDDESSSKSLGIEVNAVYDDSSTTSTTTPTTNSKLTAVQVMRIDKDGRVGKDGRIRVGDSIVEINSRPVYQMSILRARAYINDLEVLEKDVTLTIARSIESFLEQEAEANANLDTKPIFSALQQANTQYIGHTTIVELIKSSNGFGFTVTGRETAKGERLFYIGTVKPYGVALGHLKSGDRLLEINGISTGNLTQQQIVEKLKEAMVGEKVRFLVSRVSQTSNSSSTMTPSTSFDNKENEEKTPTTTTTKATKEEEAAEQKLTNRLSSSENGEKRRRSDEEESQRFEFIIPLNDTGSAGLGVSLKARVSVKSNGSRHDCGIFIKNVMHGGAAFKDGRLKINDRIIGIENIDLESMSNALASETLTKQLKSIGPTMSHVRLIIIREDEKLKTAGAISRDSSRITVDASSPAPSRVSSSNADSVLPSPSHLRATSSSGAESSVHSRQSSSSSSSLPKKVRMKKKLVDDVETNEEIDPFDREAPGRKSLSEKRGISGAADPKHIKLFQEIKHQRQNSAPPSSTLRSEKRSKSQPRSMSQRNYRQLAPKESSPTILEPPSSTTLPREMTTTTCVDENRDQSGLLSRRSLSMESINRPAGSVLRSAGSSNTPIVLNSPKVQFTAGQHPFPPGSPLMRLKNEESRARDKSRRKSVGNAMKSFFGFGNKSREESPEKTSSSPQNQQKTPTIGGDGGSRRRASENVFVDYGDGYGIVPSQYPPPPPPPPPPSLPPSLPSSLAPIQSQIQQSNNNNSVRLLSYTKLRGNSPPTPPAIEKSPTVYLGNSKFYSSYRAPNSRLAADTNHTSTLNCTIDTPHIGTIINNNNNNNNIINNGTMKMAEVGIIGQDGNQHHHLLRDQRRRQMNRPMSTMDYQQFIRTKLTSDFHHSRQQSAEASHQGRRIVEPLIMRKPNQCINESVVRAERGIGTPDEATITTCSTRGLPTQAVGQSEPHRHFAVAEAMDRRFELQPRRQSNELEATMESTLRDKQEARRAVQLELATGASVPIGRRKSMRMLEIEGSMVDRPECLYRDTAEESVRRHLPPGSTNDRDQNRRTNQNAEMSRLIVFPSTRFPIASSSMRVSSSSSKPSIFSNSISMRPIHNESQNPLNERMSLRARKKLRRDAVTRSEIFNPARQQIDDEPSFIYKNLLPPSTSTIMSTSEIPIIRKKSAN